MQTHSSGPKEIDLENIPVELEIKALIEETKELLSGDFFNTEFNDPGIVNTETQ
jgi:hypothetical protein